MTLERLFDFVKKNNIPLNSKIIVRIDFLRKDHDNSICYTECDTAFTETDCRNNKSIVLCGDIFENIKVD